MRRPLLALLALFATVALLAGCGASGGQDAVDAGAPTTAAPDGGTDGEQPDQGDETDDTEPSNGPSGVALSDLEAILPTEADLGGDYVATADDADDDGSDDETDPELEADDASDDAFLEACPAAAELEFLDDVGDDDEQAVAGFETEDQREIEVSLAPQAPAAFSGDNLDTIVDALSDCGTIEVEEDGTKITFTITAERDDTYGEDGLRLDMDASFELMGMALDLTFVGRAFTIGDVGVFISGTSGLATEDGSFEATTVPVDADLVEELAALMEERVGAL